MGDRCVAMGPTQRLVHFMDRIAPVNFVVVADVLGEIDRRTLERALDDARRRHPLLRVRVERGGSRARPQLLFCEDSVEAPAVRELAAEVFDEAGLVREAERELALPFDADRGPLARAAVATDGAGRTRLLLTMHHAIADGASGAILLGDLLSACGGAEATSGDAEAVALSPPGPRFPAVGTARRLVDLGLLFARAAWHWAGRRPVGRNVPGLNAPAAGRTTAVIPHELSRERTSALAAAAKERGATVGGVLSAALARSVYRASGAKGPAWVSLINAVNVRAAAGPEAAERVDLLMSFVVTYHRLGDGRGLFELARECSETVRRAVDRREAVVPHTLASFLPSFEPVEAARASIRVADRFATSASLTNVGRVDLPERFGALALERVSFVPSLGFMGRFAGVASTFAGRLTWNFAYVRQVVGDDLAREIADGAIGELATNQHR